MFGANALRVAYGIRVAERDDELIGIVERALEGASEGVVPGKYWVDTFPILKHVPAWLPGTDWKRKAARWKVDVIATKEMPWKNMNVWLFQSRALVVYLMHAQYCLCFLVSGPIFPYQYTTHGENVSSRWRSIP